MKKPLKNKKSLHVKLGDKVKIISGQSKGKIGIVKGLIRETRKIII